MAKKKKTATPATTIKENGKTFTKKSCHKTVSEAKKTAQRLADQGYTYRRKGKCVYQGKKRKK